MAKGVCVGREAQWRALQGIFFACLCVSMRSCPAGVRSILLFPIFLGCCWKLLPVPKAFEKLITMYGFHNKSSTGNKEGTLCRRAGERSREQGESKSQLQTDKWMDVPVLGVMHSLCCSKCWGSYICFTVGWQHSALHTNRNSWAAMLGNRLIRSESNSGSCACANPNWHVPSSLSLSLSLYGECLSIV